MISGGRKGAALLLLKRMYFWEFKCTIFSPLSVKVYTYIRFGACKGEASHCLSENWYFQAICAYFQALFWSKFTEIYNFWWLLVTTRNISLLVVTRGSRSFYKRMCISSSWEPLPKKIILQAKYA